MRRVVGEASRFGVVGALGFVVDVGVFNLLRLVVGVGPITSKALAVLAAATVAYLANKHWAFAHRESVHPPHREYTLFLALNGVGLGLTLVPLAVSYYLLGWTSALAQNVSANVVGLALGTAFRFWAYRRWVFTHMPEPVEEVDEPMEAMAA